MLCIVRLKLAPAVEVCVCACVRACVRACVCVCAVCVWVGGEGVCMPVHMFVVCVCVPFANSCLFWRVL